MSFLDFLRSGKGGTPIGRNGESLARPRILTILTVLLVLDGVLVFFVLWPPGQTPEQRQAELRRSRGQYESLLNTVKQMRDLRIKMQSAIQNDQQFSRDHFLRRKTAFSAMVTDLEQLANQNHLKTSSVSYRLKEDADQMEFVNVELSLSVDGQYSDLVRFINRVEQSQLFWIIDSMSVGTSPGQGQGLRLNLLMGTYVVSS